MEHKHRNVFLVASSHLGGRRGKTAHPSYSCVTSALSVSPLPSPGRTGNNPASSNCHAKWPRPRAGWWSRVGGGRALPAGQLAFWLGRQITTHSSRQLQARQSAGCLAQRRPCPRPKLRARRDTSSRGLEPISSHTGRSKSHVVCRKKLVCSLSIHCFIWVFTRVWKWTHCYISTDPF